MGCDKPMDIPDGNWFIDDVYPDHRVGSRVSYECNDGYRISGSSSIVCDFSGYWSDNAPKCLRKGIRMMTWINILVLTDCTVPRFTVYHSLVSSKEHTCVIVMRIVLWA